MSQTFDGIKQQLWNHYQVLLDRALELGFVFESQGGVVYEPRQKYNYPVDQLIFTREEIELWKLYGENL
jgi:hypothetical protein